MTPIAQETQQQNIKDEPKTVQKKAPETSTTGEPDTRST